MRSGKSPRLNPNCRRAAARQTAVSSHRRVTDVVELGPVNASIHKVNEHVKASDVVQLASMYERILEKLLLA